MAKLFNKKLSKITILPFGTIFEVDSNDNVKLSEEFLIIIAGPLGSLFLMQFNELEYINKVILIFNLLPIYPLDGGKLFEIILCKFLSFKTVLKIIYITSIILSFSMIIIGIVYNSLNLLLIGSAFLVINFKYLEDIDLRYWQFINDKLIYKRTLPLKKIKINSQKDLYRGFNNFYLDNKILLNEIEIIKHTLNV